MIWGLRRKIGGRPPPRNGWGPPETKYWLRPCPGPQVKIQYDVIPQVIFHYPGQNVIKIYYVITQANFHYP